MLTNQTWLVRAWFPRAQTSPDSCPKKTLPTLEFLSELQPFIRMGWDRQGVAGMVPAPSHPTARSGPGECEPPPPPSWEREGRGRGVSLQCFPGKQPLKISFIFIRAITKISSVDKCLASNWGSKMLVLFSSHLIS